MRDLQILVGILMLAGCVARGDEPDPKRVGAFIDRMTVVVETCGGVATSRSQQCACDHAGVGVRCYHAAAFVAFRGDSVPVDPSDVLVYSPTVVPSYENSDGHARFWSDAWNSHIIPVRNGWYRVGNCPLCD